MLVKEIMNKSPKLINSNTKLCEAYEIMQKNGIRHLPVIENGKLVGVVTDRDLRLATSRLAKKPFNPEDEVKKVMSSPVQTINANDPVEQAVRIMRELKIGCLPVIEGGEIVGLITVSDILDAMLKLIGINLPSGRLDLRMENRPGQLAKLANLLAEKNINIHSILTYPENGKRSRLILRVGTMEIRPLAKEICNLGIEVVWPPKISCVK
ncbi:acetoin utilization protein AcuB [Thermotomaculum hydrothermale]|uniref:Acetoin utilization protein AcuB n=1 Tax=Thermotomaculum hydrothermale TaxID=981385 RepID=A0A7R6PM40_9BACT|nr:CBS and ACT domain-containing protein [Thermotomaculum hydrothermale]BBB32617.1 acetoin utilization protein AcuB [Thermotomaculum hydrothermale]